MVPDITPQVFYSTLAPELHEKGSVEENAASLQVAKLARKWPWMITVVVAAAIAIGIGVGVWRHRHLSQAPSVPRCGVDRDRASFWLTLHRPLVPQTPHNTSSSNTTRAEQYILNDTSLAVLIRTNGDRQLFFQDNTGLIRNAIRTSTDTQWSMGPDISVSSTVKNNTPLAVNFRSDDDYPSVTIQKFNNAFSVQAKFCSDPSLLHFREPYSAFEFFRGHLLASRCRWSISKFHYYCSELYYQ